MTAKVGQLLEHFARLAANVTGTSSAIISVSGGRAEPGMRRASHGLSHEQAIEAQYMEGVLASGPNLMVVPDLTREDAFSAMTAAAEHGCFRFLVHMKLISSGGERVGSLCLLDEHPRTGLAEAQLTALGHIASMILADRQREQRHLHLMHVANRALRVDRMLRLVSEAESCADALTSLLEALCHFHGASIGQIWQLMEPGEPLTEISRYHQDLQTGDAWQAMEPLATLQEMTTETIRRNKPHAITLSPLAVFDDSGEAGPVSFSGHVCVPIWVHQQRFGITLTFTRANAELDPVVADITSLGDTIRPALFQKVTEERMRFAAYHDDLTQLPNRLMFQERLRKAIAAARFGGGEFAVLCLDLDGFKLINDTHGHGFGDTLLVGVARRLRRTKHIFIIAPHRLGATIGARRAS